MVEQHNLRPPGAREFFAGGVECFHKTRDFFIPLPKRRNLNIAARGHGKFMAIGISCSDPHWGTALLDRFWRRGAFGERMIGALLGIITLPKLFDCWNQFAHTLPCIPGIKPRHHTLVFIAIGPTCDAQIQPSLKDQIRHRGFSCQSDRMPEWRDDGPRPQSNVFGLSPQINQIEKRVRRNREIHPMVFTGPNRMHTAIVGNLGQFHKLIIKRALILIRRGTLHMDKKRKPHPSGASYCKILRTSPLF